jgi:serine/threonine-protein kinase
MKHTTEAPAAPSALAPGIPADLDRVVLRALAKNPADRYQSAAEFDSDLARIEAGLPVASETAEAATAVLAGVSSTAPTEVIRTGPGGAPPGGGRRPPYDPYQRPRKKRSILPWLITLIVLAVLGGAGWYAYNQINDRLIESKPVAVPFVEGIPQQQAEQLIRDAELVPVVKEEPSDDVKAGTVIRQSPEAGTKIQKGQNVTIVVSSGVEKVTVPDVVGQSQADATKALQDADLRVDPKPVFSKKPVGTVVDQNPNAGEDVPKGSTVIIKISQGEQLLDVPNVIGNGQATAEQILVDSGFKVAVEQVESSQDAGIVIAQTPNGGKAAKGSTVTIVISTGPPPEPEPTTNIVPEVIGFSEFEATAALNLSGFDVAVSEVPAIGPEEEGLVLNQDPPGGTELELGSTVTIQVGVLP